MDALSKLELLAVLAVARTRSERDFLMILVAYCHGLRASEVIAIRRHDIEDGCLKVRRLKGSKKTNQPLLDHDNPLLNERKALFDFIENLHPNQKLFPVCRRTFGRIVERHAKDAGMPLHKRHPHMLKHTMGTEIYEKTKDLRLVRTHLGHKREASSLMYAGRAEEQAAAVEVQAVVRADAF